jgi:hypothetical protein
MTAPEIMSPELLEHIWMYTEYWWCLSLYCIKTGTHVEIC